MITKTLEKIALGDVIDQARGLSTQYLDSNYPNMQEWARLNYIPTPKKYLKKTAGKLSKLQLHQLRMRAHQGISGAKDALSRIASKGGTASGQKKTALKYLEQEKNNQHFGHRDYQHMMLGDDLL